jgi:uncharacterized Zn-binding protein involved in type VI secretion
MNRSVRTLAFVSLMFSASSMSAQQPAGRLGDTTSGGGQVISGATTVLINGRPAARVGDQILTPRVEPQGPCVGGPIVSGSATVFIEGRPAARTGDLAVTACGPEAIVTGSPNVVIGN